MAEEQLPALAQYLSKLSPTKAGDHEGKLVRLWFGDNSSPHLCVVLNYDAVGIQVKDTQLPTARPEDTQFYLWHRIVKIEP